MSGLTSEPSVDCLGGITVPSCGRFSKVAVKKGVQHREQCHDHTFTVQLSFWALKSVQAG